MNEETQQPEIEPHVEDLAPDKAMEAHPASPEESLAEEQLSAEQIADEQPAEEPALEPEVDDADSDSAPLEEASAEAPADEAPVIEEFMIEELIVEEVKFQNESPEELVSVGVDEQDETIPGVISDEASGEISDDAVTPENAELPVEAKADAEAEAGSEEQIATDAELPLEALAEAEDVSEAQVNANAELPVETVVEPEAVSEEQITATRDELKPAIECLLFVADEPLPFKQLCKVLGEVSEEDVLWALGELVAEYDVRNSGLEVREIAGGWRISTRPQNHEFIRKYLKSRPSARLSLPALETLAVIAYKQPITIPEILEIRGVSSSSAIKTLLEKRLIVTKGRKETVGKPMMYGTSKEFMIQFGLKDLNELPSIEDFEDLAQ